MALSIKNAKRGDYVQYIGYADFQDTDSFTVGEYYQLRADYKDKCYFNSPWAHINAGHLSFELDDKGSTINGWGAGLFKLVPIKPGNQAEIGDTVIPKNTPARSFTVTHVGDTHIQPGNWRKDCIVVICEDKKKELPLSIDQEDQDFLTSLDYTEKTQPIIRRNLAFYKRSGLPWTQEEYLKILFYTEGKTEAIHLTPKNKFIYDYGTTNSFQYDWCQQENHSNFALCKQVAYEDIFPSKRIAIVTKEHNGFPIGSCIVQIVQTNTEDPTTACTLWKLANDISDSPTTYFCRIGQHCQWEDDLFFNPCSEIPIIPAPQIKPTQKEITMPTTIQQILSRLFGLEKPTTDYENRAAYIVVAYNRDGSEMGTATAASLKIIKDKVAATPELWGCKVLAYKLEKEVSVTVPVKATDITVHVPVVEEPAEK